MSGYWRRGIPLCCTMAALAAGFCSIVAAADGRFLLAAQLIMLSMILDGLDGNLARLLRGTSRIGADLDTFVDVISFGLAPALLAYEAALHAFGVWGLGMSAAVLMSGAYRLARFRVIDPYRGQRGYLGLPITVNAGWLAMFVFITESGLLDGQGFSLVEGPLAALIWTCTMVFIVLQVSRLHYAKPTKTPIAFFSCSVFVLLLFLQIQVAVASALAICMGLFFYAAVSPFLPRPAMAPHLELDETEDEDPVTVQHPWDRAGRTGSLGIGAR